jgi:hypothetical protein
MTTTITEFSPSILADIVAAFGASGAAVVGVITFWFFRKEHQLNGLVTTFKVLNDREARRRKMILLVTS